MRATGHNWPDPPQRCSMHLFPKTDCLGHETYTCYHTCRTKTLGKTHVSPDLHNRRSSTCFQSLTAELHRKLVIHLIANTSTTDWWQQCLIWLKTWRFTAPLVWKLIFLDKESARICRFPVMYFSESESFWHWTEPRFYRWRYLFPEWKPPWLFTQAPTKELSVKINWFQLSWFLNHFKVTT